ncbi:M23 family metallopeptidase [Parasphingorhabdus halotolerans]|uniref:M23 family metallopeptidase n=1 Tax=Parasphingorhabdus halotolerans TaxID=2725558 RepID=A0A6H2DQ63_9SPHN|nr:M23 family metallopeptidase [Parasphingorhabdus halotolerans]QJB69901.1 M23 family metallopeptidase [Parasphingorhabdus halotolerans]
MTLFAFSMFCSGPISHAMQPPALETSETAPQGRLAIGPMPMEVIEAHIPTKPVPVRVNDRAQLSYEITIANGISNAFELRRIEAFDVRFPADPVATWDMDYLGEHFLRHGMRPPTGNTVVAGNGFGIANLRFDIAENALPSVIFHRLIFNAILRDGSTRQLIIEAARTEVPAMTDLVLSPPFRNGAWFYSTDSHRDTRIITEGRPSYAQRYAIDWARVEYNGTFRQGEDGSNQSYVGYGAELLAVADGTIVALRNDMPENIAEGEGAVLKPSQDTLVGNFVMIDIGGINAVYAHLVPGSIRLAVGDSVKQGDIIGRLGNSGNSDGPHLHFHLETRTPANVPLSGEGVPYHFATFRQIAKYPEQELEALFDGKRLPLNLSPIKTFEALPQGAGIVYFGGD